MLTAGCCFVGCRGLVRAPVGAGTFNVSYHAASSAVTLDAGLSRSSGSASTTPGCHVYACDRLSRAGCLDAMPRLSDPRRFRRNGSAPMIRRRRHQPAGGDGLAISNDLGHQRLRRSARPITLLTGLGRSVSGMYLRQSQRGYMHCPRIRCTRQL